MIKYGILSALLLGIIFTFQCTVVNEDPEIADLKKYIDNIQESDFSGALLIAKNHKVNIENAFGFASREYAFENRTSTLFNIASITKLFTAVAALQLVEKGKLDLNEPIGSYLPDYPNQLVKDSVTINQLLTHTSGLNNFYVNRFIKSPKLDYTAVADFLLLFATDSLLSSPGTQYNYSASGFVVLGLLIEHASGKSYYQYLQDHIFRIANMENTYAFSTDTIVQNRASGYTSYFGDEAIFSKNDHYLAKASPGGFYYSSVKDLYLFMDALCQFKLISQELTKDMFSPKVKGYNTFLGYGIDIDQSYNQEIIGHSGGWYGIRCELMYFEKSKIIGVVLSNQDDNGETGASKVINDIKNIIAG